MNRTANTIRKIKAGIKIKQMSIFFKSEKHFHFCLSSDNNMGFIWNSDSVKAENRITTNPFHVNTMCYSFLGVANKHHCNAVQCLWTTIKSCSEWITSQLES